MARENTGWCWRIIEPVIEAIKILAELRAEQDGTAAAILVQPVQEMERSR